jgi:hypothetical protein
MFESTTDFVFEGEELARATRGLSEGGRVFAEAVANGECGPVEDPRSFGWSTRSSPR